MNLSGWSPFLLSILRIMAGALFIEHGMSKVFGIPAPMGGGHPLTGMVAASAYIELIGGGLILLGLFTRFAAFICSGEMAVAYFTAHAPKGFWPMTGGGNGGELAVLYCFVFLYLVFAGSGPISIDRLRGKS